MTTHQIAELRRWRRSHYCIIGFVYSDPKDIYEDGELAEINIGEMLDKGTHYLLRQNGSQVLYFKLMKDEEIV